MERSSKRTTFVSLPWCMQTRARARLCEECSTTLEICLRGEWVREGGPMSFPGLNRSSRYSHWTLLSGGSRPTNKRAGQAASRAKGGSAQSARPSLPDMGSSSIMSHSRWVGGLVSFAFCGQWEHWRRREARASEKSPMGYSGEDARFHQWCVAFCGAELKVR